MYGHGRRRNRLHITANILSVAGEGAKKTQIMYRANLSYNLLGKHLTEVLDAGLLSFDGANRYRVTRKGLEFLDRCNEYFMLCEWLEKSFDDVSHEKMALMEMVGADLDSRPNNRTVISKAI